MQRDFSFLRGPRGDSRATDMAMTHAERSSLLAAHVVAGGRPLRHHFAGRARTVRPIILATVS